MIYFFQHHGHCLPECKHPDLIRRNVTITSKNCFGISVKTLLEKTKQEEKFLLSKDSVNFYDVMYECTWRQFKKEHAILMNEFWQNSKLDPKRPLCRLVPRASIRGGFNELYKLYSEATDSQHLYYYDANSLYSYIARDMDFPVGKYEVILEDQLKLHLKIHNNRFFYKGEDCSCDIAHVSLLAPRNLYAPFLSLRFGEQSYTSLCSKCVQIKNTGVCRHKCPNKRRLVSTYTVVEIEYALSLGYELLFVYELYHYSNKAKVLSDFIKVISSFKLKATNLFENIAEESRQQLCDELNAKMLFDKPSLELTPNNVIPNSSEKQFLKDLLNSLFGRFALNSNHSKREFVRSQAQLESLLANKDFELLDFFPVNNSTMQIEYLKTGLTLASREGNLFYTALINAKARIFMYEHIKKLSADNCTVIYCDTDSLLFSASPHYKLPFDVTPAFGDFKPVLGSTAVIKKFYSLGCKNYCLLYTESGKLSYVTKIKGLSVNSHNLTDKVTPEIYETFIKAHFEDRVLHEYIPQSRCKIEKQTRTFKQIMLTQQFTNTLHLKRFILKKQRNYVTYPYGYNFGNVQHRI